MGEGIEEEQLSMKENVQAPSIPLVQRVSAVLWPAFLCAGAATGVFFTFFDPITLLECEGEPPMSRMGAYTLGFFMFWLLCIASSIGTSYFLGTEARHSVQPVQTS